MKKIMIVLFVSMFVLFVGCMEHPQQKKINSNLPNINYANKTEVITLFKKVQNLTTNDTILLGFRLGMSKREYQNHFKKLQSEGVITNDYGYDRYKTDISFSKNNNTILGHGEYILTPIFTENDTLGCLLVNCVEYWDKNTGELYSFSWLLNNTPNKINLHGDGDTSFINSLNHYRLVNDYASVYKRNNTIITKNFHSNTLQYWDFKVLLGELLIQMQIEENRKSKAKSAENII